MENAFKRALARRRPQIGLWNGLCSPLAAEISAGAGYDWLLFDSEHAPLEVAGLLPLLQAAGAGPAHAAVRVAWNDPVLLKRVLDLGAQTIFAPFIQSAAEARALVAACRYPPQGRRGVAGATRASGFGRTPDYIHRANAEICIIAQVETGSALDRLEEIAAVEGIDGIFIGPSDLSASLGHPGNPGHDEMQTILRALPARLAEVDMPAGILATSAEAARRYLDWGYGFVAAGVDVALLTRAVDRLLADVRENPHG